MVLNRHRKSSEKQPEKPRLVDNGQPSMPNLVENDGSPVGSPAMPRLVGNNTNLEDLPPLLSINDAIVGSGMIAACEYGDVYISGNQNLNEIEIMKASLNDKPIYANDGAPFYTVPEWIEARMDEDVTNAQNRLYISHLSSRGFNDSIQHYFRSISVIDQSVSLSKNTNSQDRSVHDYQCLAGHGTTELFSLAVRTLIKSPGDVVLVTAPTYGLFLEPVCMAQGKVEQCVLEEKHGYKVQGDQLAQVIEEKITAFKEHALEHVNCIARRISEIRKHEQVSDEIKNNIDKYIDISISELCELYRRSAQDIDFKKADQLIDQLNDAMGDIKNGIKMEFDLLFRESLYFPYCNRVAAYYHINPHMPYGTVMNQGEIDRLANVLCQYKNLIVIDDLNYYDLVLPPCNELPGTFAKSPMKGRALTLYGLSKQFSLAGARAGLIMGSKKHITPVANEFLYHTCMQSDYTKIALYAAIEMPEAERVECFNNTNDAYALKRDLAYALVKGIKALPNQRYVEKIKKIVNEAEPDPTVRAELLEGIKEVDCITYPDSGYYLVLDLSKHLNRYLEKTLITTTEDMYDILKKIVNLYTISGDDNLEPKSGRLRFTFAMEDNIIVDAMKRLRFIVDRLTERPENRTVANTNFSVCNSPRISAPKPASPDYEELVTRLNRITRNRESQEALIVKKVIDTRRASAFLLRKQKRSMTPITDSSVCSQEVDAGEYMEYLGRNRNTVVYSSGQGV